MFLVWRTTVSHNRQSLLEDGGLGKGEEGEKTENRSFLICVISAWALSLSQAKRARVFFFSRTSTTRCGWPTAYNRVCAVQKLAEERWAAALAPRGWSSIPTIPREALKYALAHSLPTLEQKHPPFWFPPPTLFLRCVQPRWRDRFDEVNYPNRCAGYNLSLPLSRSLFSTVPPLFLFWRNHNCDGSFSR